jgi:ankyrin repeat protein
MGLSVAVFGILAFSGEIWHRIFADRLANGSYAAGFFTEAASAGDLTTVAAFLANGTTVDIRRRRDGWTGLHAAAAGGHTDVIRYLVAAGADVNAIDRVGDSPLQLATAEHHEDAARLLADHGARIIRGSDEQLRQAIRNIVDADAKSPWRSSKTPADALRWISGK